MTLRLGPESGPSKVSGNGLCLWCSLCAVMGDVRHDSSRARSALEPCYRVAALLIRTLSTEDADRFAGALWRAHRERLVLCMEGEQPRLRPAALGLAAALTTGSRVVARELLQELERSGTRADRGLREAEAHNSTFVQLANLGHAMLGTQDNAVMLRLLSGEHRHLASAPLRLLPRLAESLQISILSTVRTCVLLSDQIPLRAKLAPCTPTLEQVAMLYGKAGSVAEAAHTHLLLVCTTLIPALASSRSSIMPSPESDTVASKSAAVGASNDGGGSSDGGARLSAAHDAVLRMLLTLRPTTDGRQQSLLLRTLKALPAIIPVYMRLRAGVSAASDPHESRHWLTFAAFMSRLVRVSLSGCRMPQQLPSNTAAASALVDALLPPALCRPLWSRALLHSSFLVRLYGVHVLHSLLPQLKSRLIAPLAARASSDPNAAIGLRVLTAELYRRLPDMQVLLSGHGGRGRPASSAGSSRGGGGKVADGHSAALASGHASGKLLELIDARLLEALWMYAEMFPSVAADAVAHAERLLRVKALQMAPVSLYNALNLLSSASAVSRDPSATDGGEQPTAVTPARPSDTIALPPHADLAALLRLACSPQPASLRALLWRHLATQLRRCGALHLASHATIEAGVWLQGLRIDEDASALAGLLHSCVSSLHLHVDQATDLTSSQESLPAAAGRQNRLSPLVMCTVSRLRALSDKSAEENNEQQTLAIPYMCRCLASVGIMGKPTARLLHAAVLQSGASDISTARNPLSNSEAASDVCTCYQLTQFLAMQISASDRDVNEKGIMAEDNSRQRGSKTTMSQSRHASWVGAEESKSDTRVGIAELLEWHHALRASTLGRKRQLSKRIGEGDGATAKRARLNSSCDEAATLAFLPSRDTAALAPILLDSPSLHAECRSYLARTVTAGEASALRPDIPLLEAWVRCEMISRVRGSPSEQHTRLCAADGAMAETSAAWLQPLVHLCCTHASLTTGGLLAEDELDTAWRAASLFGLVVREAPPGLSECERLAKTLRDATIETSASPCGWPAAAALCHLVCCTSMTTTTAMVQSTTELCLRSLRGQDDARAVSLCDALLGLLHSPSHTDLFASAPESFLYEMRDFMRAACTVTTLHIATKLLEMGAGRAMMALLPQLQRQIITHSQLLANVARMPPRAPSKALDAARYQLRFLTALARDSPSSIDADAACLLLKVSTCLPPTSRRVVWSLMAQHIADGTTLPTFERAHAIDFASHAMHISNGRALSAGGTEGVETDEKGDVGRAEAAWFAEDPVQLMTHELTALQWMRADEAAVLVEGFPHDLLQLPAAAAATCRDAITAYGSAEDGEASFEEEFASSRRRGSPVGCDPLGALLALQVILSTSKIDTRQWVDRGATGLCVMALSVDCASVRSVAYDCLGRFMALLMDGKSFVERRQIVRILCSLRDAVTSANMRLPRIITSFVAHGLRVLLRPTHPQYRALNAYVVGRPYLRLDELPMFFESFHGGGSRSREERIWVLQLIGRSLSSPDDLAAHRSRHTLQLVLSLHDSHLADSPTRKACMSVLLAAAALPDGAAMLLQEHGAVGWIATVLRRSQLVDSASSKEAVGALASLFRRLLHSPASKSLDAPQLWQCMLAVHQLWAAVRCSLGCADVSGSRGDAQFMIGEKDAPLLRRMQHSSSRGLVSACVTLLTAVVALPLGGEHASCHLRAPLMYELLACTSMRDWRVPGDDCSHAQPPVAGMVEEGRRVDGLALRLLSVCSSWALTLPQHGGTELICAVEFARMGAQALLEGSRLCADELTSHTSAFAGLVAWLTRCCEHSPSFCERVVSLGYDRLFARLYRAIGGWSAGATLDELKSNSLPTQLHPAICALNQLMQILLCVRRLLARSDSGVTPCEDATSTVMPEHNKDEISRSDLDAAMLASDPSAGPAAINAATDEALRPSLVQLLQVSHAIQLVIDAES